MSQLPKFCESQFYQLPCHGVSVGLHHSNQTPRVELPRKGCVSDLIFTTSSNRWLRASPVVQSQIKDQNTCEPFARSWQMVIRSDLFLASMTRN